MPTGSDEIKQKQVDIHFRIIPDSLIPFKFRASIIFQDFIKSNQPQRHWTVTFIASFYQSRLVVQIRIGYVDKDWLC